MNYKMTIEKYLEESWQRVHLPNLCRVQNKMKNLILEKHEVNKRYKKYKLPREKKKERKITKKTGRHFEVNW